MAIITGDVYGILGDDVSEEYKKESDKLEKLREYILEHAEDFGCAELAEKYLGETIPSDDFSEEMQTVIDDYDDDVFWHELETRLGKRDLERDMSDAEREETEKTGWLPRRVQDFYEKWAREFEQYGIERLKVEK